MQLAEVQLVHCWRSQASVSLGTTFSWVDFQLSTSYTVTSGTTYGLAVMGNVPVNIRLNGGTGQRTGGPGYGSFANGFTNPFGTVWFNDVTDGAMSIYATGSGSPTPTSTPLQHQRLRQPQQQPQFQPQPQNPHQLFLGILWLVQA